jgi:phospholipid transport system transporter-binding protein
VSGAELVELGEGRFGVSGVLDFATVGGLLSQGLAAFGGNPRVELDLQGVTRSNSAALALLLEWLDLGRSQGFELHFVNLPESLLAIARMSNVEDLLESRQGRS